ncbi:hypothetical protein [Sphingorhabdus sp. SMR4y]|uniref:hypothetical protein n=1 Tax=Sphingorhabdus sp. SMR4y TaxID=2584094 RepID=UPI000B5CEB74|nr:hypothetical protein [Sphingorhabdus sp. SMR4y]ASK89180.1 hypothetical protein SPHFLASMR4Y_02439 [Sphingorhabdus sp. SMR4y]
MNVLDAVTMIIRTVGERTEEACRASIRAQGVDDAQIVTVREAPFSKAMRVSFEAGIAAGREWTFCIDADVVMRPGSIKAMLQQALQQPPEVFELQGVVLDKLFVTLREAGNHLFRTSLLPQMIELIPEEGLSLRPETTAMEGMKARGYPWAQVPYVVGLHDFGQSNRDIFRKCYTHAQKHVHLLGDILPKMRRRAATDHDFAVAIAGLAEGLKATTEVRIDIEHRPFTERFEAQGIEEKAPCTMDEFTPDRVERILLDYATADDLTIRYLPFSGPEAIALDGTTRLTPLSRWRALWRRREQHHGTGGAILYSMGRGIEQLGLRLQKRAGESK